MGLFQQGPKHEQQDWTGLPSEPLEADAADKLAAAPAVDPFAIGLGGEVTSIVFPVAPPAPDAVIIESLEPKGDD